MNILDLSDDSILLIIKELLQKKQLSSDFLRSINVDYSGESIINTFIKCGFIKNLDIFGQGFEINTSATDYFEEIKRIKNILKSKTYLKGKYSKNTNISTKEAIKEAFSKSMNEIERNRAIDILSLINEEIGNEDTIWSSVLAKRKNDDLIRKPDAKDKVFSSLRRKKYLDETNYPNITLSMLGKKRLRDISNKEIKSLTIIESALNLFKNNCDIAIIPIVGNSKNEKEIFPNVLRQGGKAIEKGSSLLFTSISKVDPSSSLIIPMYFFKKTSISVKSDQWFIINSYGLILTLQGYNVHIPQINPHNNKTILEVYNPNSTLGVISCHYQDEIESLIKESQ